jgi:hypothetical protein
MAAVTNTPVLGTRDSVLNLPLIGSSLPKKEQQVELGLFAKNMARERMAIAALVNANKVNAFSELDSRMAALLPLASGIEPTNDVLGDELQKRKDAYAIKEQLYVVSLDNYESRFGKHSRIRLEGRIKKVVDKVLATYPSAAVVHLPKTQALLKQVTSGLVDLHIRIYAKYKAEKAARIAQEMPEEKKEEEKASASPLA